MMTLEEMKRRKAEMGLSCEEISSRSGVPLGTVQKVFSGITRTPRYATLLSLAKAFSDADTKEESGLASAPTAITSPGMLRETPAVYQAANAKEYSQCNKPSTAYQIKHTETVPRCAEPPASVYGISGTSALQGDDANNDHSVERSARRDDDDHRAPNDPVLTNVHYYDRQGTYTLQDYLALPDDRRVELIDGVIYDMSAPYAGHQVISGQLTHLFNNFIDEHGGPCEVYAAPTDVQLDCDDKTILEPDVFIICNPSKVTLQRIYGAPDLVIEILSKSTRRKDLTLKLWKYCNAKVREYWIVDPHKQCVTVYDFAHDPNLTDARRYSFHDKIPVGIYDGALEIDFERIWKKIARFYPAQAGTSSADQG